MRPSRTSLFQRGRGRQRDEVVPCGDRSARAAPLAQQPDFWGSRGEPPRRVAGGHAQGSRNRRPTAHGCRCATRPGATPVAAARSLDQFGRVTASLDGPSPEGDGGGGGWVAGRTSAAGACRGNTVSVGCWGGEGCRRAAQRIRQPATDAASRADRAGCPPYSAWATTAVSVTGAAGGAREAH
jgi:hypothetical protein